MPVSDWGTVQIGRLVLREGFNITPALEGTTGNRSLAIAGEESSPPLTLAEVKRRNEDILGLQGMVLPIVFTNKEDHNGWYQIIDANTQLTNWTNEVVKFSWTIQAIRIGAERYADLESRVATVVRSNAFALTGTRWHSPAGGAVGYFTGTAQPSGSVSRASSDGTAQTVYLGVPAAVNPRWSSTLAQYQNGRARITVAGVERVALDVAISASAAWTVENGLVRVSPGASGNTLDIASWSGSAWQTIQWNGSITSASATPVTTWDAISIVRNDYEVVTLRLLKSRGTSGRAQLDLTLRRGSRFVETYLQTDTSSTMGWYRASNEAGTASGAYVTATANDGAGNRYAIGTAKAFTANLNGGISASATRTLDAWIGSVAGGGSAVAGDQAPNLRDQYISVLVENTVAVVRR